MVLEEHNDEEQVIIEVLLAECCAPSQAINPLNAIVLTPTTDEPSTSSVLQYQEPHIKDKDDDKVESRFYSSRRFILGVILLFIGGVTLVTAAIFFLQNGNGSSPSTAYTECQLLSSSCSNTKLMTEPLLICTIIRYEHLKIQLQDLTESTNIPFESCKPSSLALWQVAIDLYQTSNPTTTATRTASSSASESLSSIFENEQHDQANTSKDLVFQTAIWMNRFVIFMLYFSTGTTLPSPTDNDNICLFAGVICNGQGNIMLFISPTLCLEQEGASNSCRPY